LNLTLVTGILLIALPLAFNLIFFQLQRTFEYPNILRQPTDYILKQFLNGGSRLVATWYAFAFAGLLFIPAAILTPLVLAANLPLFALAAAIGVVAGLVQVLGLLRWTFVVPYLASAYADASSTPATRDAVEVVFQTFHRYAGVAIGEHLGYLFTGVWTILIAIAVTQSPTLPTWLGWLGLIPAVGILVGMLEPAGVKAVGLINALSYILWSLWLIVLGILLVLGA